MLEILITSKTRRDILILLILNPDKEYYLREISRKVLQQPNLVTNELRRLEGAGILKSRKSEASTYYSINKKNPIYNELKSIVVKAYAFDVVLKKMLLGWNRIHIAFVYGSFARGEEKATSDIDLMVVGDVPLEEFDKSVKLAEKVLGREINYNVFPVAEFAKKSDSSFIAHILKEKKIVIMGDENELERLVKGK